MAFQVLLTDDAVRDLEEIRDYLDARESPARADDVLDRIEAAFEGLSGHPHRGRHPGELLDIGIREYREVFIKPYPIQRWAGGRFRWRLRQSGYWRPCPAMRTILRAYPF